MHCANCGSEIEKGERFCYRCGAAVAAEVGSNRRGIRGKTYTERMITQ